MPRVPKRAGTAGENEALGFRISCGKALGPVPEGSDCGKIFCPVAQDFHDPRRGVHVAEKRALCVEELGDILPGNQSALKRLEERCDRQPQVHDVAAALLDRHEQPPVRLLGQVHQPRQAVLLGKEIEHGADGIGRLEVIQEGVSAIRRVVHGHPVPVPAPHLAPLAGGVSVPRGQQGLSGAQAGGGVAELLRVARGQRVLALGMLPRRGELDDGPRVRPAEPGAMFFQERRDPAIHEALKAMERSPAQGLLRLVPLVRAQDHRPGLPSEHVSGAAAAGVINALDGKVGALVSVITCVADG